LGNLDPYTADMSKDIPMWHCVQNGHQWSQLCNCTRLP